MKKIIVAVLVAFMAVGYGVSATAEEDFVWIDSAEGPAFKLYNPSVDMIFFSVERPNPYSEEELQHEITEKDYLPWMQRVENCKTLTVYDEFADCMFRPWRYGF